MTEVTDSGSNQRPPDTRDLIERYCRTALAVAAGIAFVTLAYFGAVFWVIRR